MSTEHESFFLDTVKSAGIPTTEAELKTEFENQAQAQGLDFQNTNGNSPWWQFLKSAAITPALWFVKFAISVLLPNQFIKTATGEFLDLLAWAYGDDMARKKATKAKGLIQFNRDSVGTALTIPAGTWIKTAPINGVVYRVKTTKESAFGVNDFSLMVEVEAEKTGLAYNLAGGYYIILAEPITGISSVTNGDDWLTVPGADKETDDDYRARLREYYSTVSDHHTNSVYKTIIARRTGFKVDRIYIDHTSAPRGPGSADAFVLFDVGTPAQSYLDDVNNYIRDEGMHGHGDDIEVKAMPETLHDLTLTVWVPAGLGVDEKAELQTNIEQMIRCAFRENTNFEATLTWPYSRFSFGRLSGELMRRFLNVHSIEWGQGDIESNNDVPRIDSLTITMQELT